MNSRVDAPDAKVSWGKISESEHIAQFYVDNSALMDALTGFLSEALNSGNSAIVIATPEHLRTLFRLACRGRVWTCNAPFWKTALLRWTRQLHSLRLWKTTGRMRSFSAYLFRA